MSPTTMSPLNSGRSMSTKASTERAGATFRRYHHAVNRRLTPASITIDRLPLASRFVAITLVSSVPASSMSARPVSISSWGKLPAPWLLISAFEIAYA